MTPAGLSLLAVLVVLLMVALAAWDTKRRELRQERSEKEWWQKEYGAVSAALLKRQQQDKAMEDMQRRMVRTERPVTLLTKRHLLLDQHAPRQENMEWFMQHVCHSLKRELAEEAVQHARLNTRRDEGLRQTELTVTLALVEPGL